LCSGVNWKLTPGGSNSGYCIYQCDSHENCEKLLKAVKATGGKDGGIYVSGEHGEVVPISDSDADTDDAEERKVVMKEGAYGGKGIGDEFRAEVYKYYDAGHGPGAIWTRLTADYDKGALKQKRIPSVGKLTSHVQGLRNRPLEQIKTNGDLTTWVHGKMCPVPITEATVVRVCLHHESCIYCRGADVLLCFCCVCGRPCQFDCRCPFDSTADAARANARADTHADARSAPA